MNTKTLWIGIGLTICACSEDKPQSSFVEENTEHARRQIGGEINAIEASGKFRNPVHVKKNGETFHCDYGDWRSGFFPGSVWYLYELSGDTTLLPIARKYTETLKEVQNITWSHDVGFMVGCSFGNGLRLTGDTAYASVIQQTAKSLCTRYRPSARVIQSWNVDSGWMSHRGWECPVIIDNMMNLELLFQATRLSGDSTYYKVAVAHADKTLKEHFHPNDSAAYHVVDYHLADGSVRSQGTAQGYSNQSVWSRGQAWAIYGYAVCYRETNDKRFLEQALRTFQLMRNHPRMPKDCIPYWDMDAPNIPDAPRDASSAACIASALYEISTFDILDAASYKEYADQMMTSLASPAYRAEIGRNGNFLLMHSVGSIPHRSEIDVPLNYADYYFLEALKRKRDIEK